jgi:hypothetical protein
MSETYIWALKIKRNSGIISDLIPLVNQVNAKNEEDRQWINSVDAAFRIIIGG